MQILLTGGTGFIGCELLKQLSTHQITLFTRNIAKAKKKLRHIDPGNITYINSLEQYSDFNDIDAIINLAGEPIVGKRWSPQQKQKICDSRWSITKKLVELIRASTVPPAIFISGSAVGYYGDQQDSSIDESFSGDMQGFTHEVCATWESIARQAQSQTTRVCIIRTGVVLGLSGGALAMMLLPFKFALGSRLGDGQQYMPWIHITDMVRGIIFLLEMPELHGDFNFCAPNPSTNSEFSNTLAATLSRPLFLAAPKRVIDFALGEASCLLFDSIRAKPGHLLASGFQFTYPRLAPALYALLLNE